MKAADNGHLDVVTCIITEYRNVIDIDANDNVSVDMCYVFYCVLMYIFNMMCYFAAYAYLYFVFCIYDCFL